MRNDNLHYHVFVSQVCWSEINDGDVFVLETAHKVFVWTGRYSNNIEKLKAAKVGTATIVNNATDVGIIAGIVAEHTTIYNGVSINNII